MPNQTEDTGVVINNDGVLRDEKGRFLKGTKSANPNGSDGASDFKRRVRELVGNDCREIALKLAEIGFYNQEDYNHRWPKIKTMEQLKAIEIMLKYTEKLPVQEIKAEVEMKTVNVHIDIPSTDIDITDI